MTITELVEMAERIHDTEGHNLGSNSTRDTRNAFWMRVVGCAHFGHPAYNPTPDPRWHVKDGGGGRPMSDDVAVLMPSREAWDCIPGAGSNGYRFEADAIGVLPMVQHVYAPDRPSGGSLAPVPPPVTTQPYPDEIAWWEQVFDVEAAKRYARAVPPQPYPNPRSARWSNRTAYDIAAGMTKEASMAKHLKELEDELRLS